MAKEHHLELIRQGVEVWNKWREDHPGENIDLSEADLDNTDFQGFNLSKANLSNAKLHKTDLRKANLNNANLSGADLHENNLTETDIQGAIYIETNLYRTNLSGSDFKDANMSNSNLSSANLSNADLFRANLYQANLSKSTLCEADLSEANLYRADLSDANLTGASIRKAILVEVILEGAILTNSSVYGLSAWGCKGVPKNQSNLIITPLGETAITIDDLHVAQFVYLLLNQENLRNVINTVTSKAVLILGRFTTERKIILGAMANELRKHNLLPIVFDFERPIDRDFTETIKTLAGFSLFIIADITNPSSSPLELQATVPDYKIPFVPIIQEGEKPFAMLSDLIGKYDWVLGPVITYHSLDNLIGAFKPAIIDRAWSKHQELQKQKTSIIETLSIDSFLNKSTSL